MREIRITVSDETHDRLTDVKDGRTWREALKEEFGLDA